MEDALELARRLRKESVESGKKAHERYQFCVTLKKKEDEKIVEKFESVPNKTDYIRQLVLADIEKNKQN